ncbi:MAG: helix-turn-helix domain-containing protein [Bauldia sp.]|uniref:GlxA family transcriptional regulator n=1 Tax=Bauldia sp. TaxID=2575872 RepID=UPI001D776F5E|nr:helix-turn-helix domain-containing protein [Bauldia sp.]MCB1498102.1 helix-turn-helix domain-containing protein [Bauldia sp.]
MAASPSPEAIGILLYPGAQLAVIHGLTDLFTVGIRASSEIAGNDRARLEVSHWSVRASGNPAFACVHTSHPGSGRKPGILIVPPTMVGLPESGMCARIAGWLHQEHRRGARLVSICSGVVFLAQAGLVDGRTVSTHRGFAKFLAETFPDVVVDPGERIIEYPDIITAGGFMSWVDVGLLLVQDLLGDHAREKTERFLQSGSAASENPMAPRFMPPQTHGDAAIRRAQQCVHLSDGQGVSLSSMAAAARLERRTFLRRFANATGTTPAAYYRAVRMARARELLEAGNMAQKEIAERLGYIDVSSFARAFRRDQGIAPGIYRKQFGGAFFARAE